MACLARVIRTPLVGAGEPHLETHAEVLIYSQVS